MGAAATTATWLGALGSGDVEPRRKRLGILEWPRNLDRALSAARQNIQTESRSCNGTEPLHDLVWHEGGADRARRGGR